MEFLRIFLSDNVVAMEYEIVLMALLLLLTAILIKKDELLTAAWALISIFFIYIHRAFLPILLSGIWCMALLGVIAVIVRLSPGAFFIPLRWLCFRAKALIKKRPYALIVILILLIQISRVNISIDYDSIRYGLRSDVLLSDSGLTGFFTSMGLVNSVYTYPKGYELLILPLLLIMGGRSFGPALCMNIWMLIGVIFISGEIAESIYAYAFVRSAEDEREYAAGAFCAAVISLIPGITNMSVTAKSDLITLLMQLIFIYAVVRYLRDRNADLVGFGLGALILSYAFKPTALIFSSIIGIAALIYLVVMRVKLSFSAAAARACALGVLYTGAMTLRTLLITGVPFTSIYTGVFTKLGFTLKYPFRIIDSSGGAGFSLDSLETYLSRLIHFFLCPTGEDMEHVIMAWGGIVFLLIIIAALVLGVRTFANIDFIERLKSIRGEDSGSNSASPGTAAVGFIYLELSVLIVLTLVSLYFLSQVDGNYFGLFYAVSAIAGSAALLLNAEAIYLKGSGKKPRLTLSLSGSNFGVVFLATVMIFMTAVTSWCGAVGFTPVDFINRGYYDHEIMYGLKNPLDWDPHTRVVAFMYEPECYKLKGRVESWVDIDGYGGNVYLTDTKLDIFKEYLYRADIDYIYADLQFINDTTNERRVRAGVLFRYLLEDGCFSELTVDETAPNCIFCKIDRERAAVSWEEPMGEERETRTDEQLAWFDAISTPMI